MHLYLSSIFPYKRDLQNVFNTPTDLFDPFSTQVWNSQIENRKIKRVVKFFKMNGVVGTALQDFSGIWTDVLYIHT